MKMMSRKIIKRLTDNKQSPEYYRASGRTQGVKCDLIQQNFPNTKRRMGRGEEGEKEKKTLHLYIFQ